MPVFFSFQQVREDLATHTPAIASDQLWRELAGKHSLGYHLKHIAGSVDRLTTYLRGEQLSGSQLEFLGNEHRADFDLAGLLDLVLKSLAAAEQQLLRLQPETLFDPRVAGRRQLPTSVLGLLVHLCEHTQRHLGQAILLAKLLQQA
jgi:uncharacterized damage-inducible protein DinB